MKNGPVLTLTIIMLILFCSFPLAGLPEAARVKEEVNKLARELNMLPKETSDNAFSRFILKIIEGVAKFISFLVRTGPVLAILIIILIVFIIGYIGLRFFSYFRREKDKYIQSAGIYGKAGEKTGEIIHQYLEDAEALAKKNNYGEALVLLHRGSIVFLQFKNVLLAAEYHTNNEIRRELRVNEENFKTYYEPFSMIAGNAELKTFRAEVISQGMFKESLEIYKKNFLC